jgi:hypothetical protein
LGKRIHGSYITFHTNDPNDDETSDDPADDDDGWEGVRAVSETEASVFVWFDESGSRLSSGVSQWESFCSEPVHVITFLRLQRLRC